MSPEMPLSREVPSRVRVPSRYPYPGTAPFIHRRVQAAEGFEHPGRVAGRAEQRAEPVGIGRVGTLKGSAASCRQAQPHDPPVAGLGLALGIARSDQAIGGGGQRGLGDGQPLSQPGGTLADGFVPGERKKCSVRFVSGRRWAAARGGAGAPLFR